MESLAHASGYGFHQAGRSLKVPGNAIEPDQWARKTHKVYDEQWRAPQDAKLALEVRSEQANTIVVGIDNHAAEVDFAGGSDWQSFSLSPSDFQDAVGVALADWSGIRELRLGSSETLKETVDGKNIRRKLGKSWHGPPPEFRNLRWTQ